MGLAVVGRSDGMGGSVGLVPGLAVGVLVVGLAVVGRVGLPVVGLRVGERVVGRVGDRVVGVVGLAVGALFVGANVGSASFGLHAKRDGIHWHSPERFKHCSLRWILLHGVFLLRSSSCARTAATAPSMAATATAATSATSAASASAAALALSRGIPLVRTTQGAVGALSHVAAVVVVVVGFRARVRFAFACVPVLVRGVAGWDGTALQGGRPFSRSLSRVAPSARSPPPMAGRARPSRTWEPRWEQKPGEGMGSKAE